MHGMRVDACHGTTLALTRAAAAVHAHAPPGQYLLQAALNDKVQLVEFASGKVAKTYTGHANTKFCSVMAFATSLGKRPCIAAGSEDGSIFLWDVNSRDVVQRIPGRAGAEAPGDGHCAPVLCVAAHPSAPMLASAAHEPDCSVKLWSAARRGG